MKRRWLGYALWLLLAALLYFFENNTGTRTVLLCSVFFPLVPPLRAAFFSADEMGEAEAPRNVTVRSFLYREAEDAGEVRKYLPGDPVRRIHWKLSAKRDELLIRETAREEETAEAETAVSGAADDGGKARRKRAVWLPAAAMLLCLTALLLIPEAKRGAQALCNRVFAASERVNAYVYDYFPVAENQRVTLAAGLIAAAIAAGGWMLILLRGNLAALCLMAACTLFQVYFGLAFPVWVTVPLYGMLAFWLMKAPRRGKTLLACAMAAALALLLVSAVMPGVDAATEAASETVRDRLSQMALQLTGAVSEQPTGETETRHVHTQSLKTGGDEAQTGREYRLVTVEEQQISMPHWVNYLRIILLLLLSAALVSLPFAPFLLLNARRRKAQAQRAVFASENVSEAVCAIFQHVMAWLRETGNGAGNLLYRDAARHLPPTLPEGYASRFAQCAEAFEEAAYSAHALPEEKRRQALELLKETERALWQTAGRRQRFRLKYWVCLCE